MEQVHISISRIGINEANEVTFSYKDCVNELKRRSWYANDDFNLGSMFPAFIKYRRLGFKEEGAGKVRIFAIPNALP